MVKQEQLISLYINRLNAQKSPGALYATGAMNLLKDIYSYALLIHRITA